jgi:hypothetical protein
VSIERERKSAGGCVGVAEGVRERERKRRRGGSRPCQASNFTLQNNQSLHTFACSTLWNTNVLQLTRNLTTATLTPPLSLVSLLALIARFVTFDLDRFPPSHHSTASTPSLAPPRPVVVIALLYSTPPPLPHSTSPPLDPLSKRMGFAELRAKAVRCLPTLLAVQNSPPHLRRKQPHQKSPSLPSLSSTTPFVRSTARRPSFSPPKSGDSRALSSRILQRRMSEEEELLRPRLGGG